MSKVILITGASTGFGRDSAETLAAAGHGVFASMRDPGGRNREHADALRGQGIAVVELDVAEDASVERAIADVLKQAGRIDVLVNNAGVFSVGVTEAFTPDQAKILFNTNVVGMLRTARAVLPTMRNQHDGLIINVSSVVGRVTLPFFGLYGSTKFAVEALSDSLRYEVSQLGVDVTLVQPSAYPTAIFDKVHLPADPTRIADYGDVGAIPDAMFKQFKTNFEAPDAPDPHDVAEAIATLVATPKGSRPARTIVGAPFGADAVNDQTAPVQAGVIEGLGLAHLAKVA